MRPNRDHTRAHIGNTGIALSVLVFLAILAPTANRIPGKIASAAPIERTASKGGCGLSMVGWRLGEASMEGSAPSWDLPSALFDWQRETAHHRPRTVEGITRCVARWAALWPERRLEEVDAETIRAHLLSYRADHAASTTNLERRNLSWFFGHCVRRGFIRKSPVDGAPYFPEETKEPRALSDEEMDRLLGRATGDLRALLLLAVETGLRRSTVLSLRWEWVDIERGWLRIPARNMKGRREYRAPLSPRALQALRSIRGSVEGRLFSFCRSSLHRRLAIASALAEIEFTFHDLRRTFFSRMRARGVPLEVAMALSDHRDVKTALRHYRAISTEELLRAVGRIGSTPSAGIVPSEG